MLKRFARWILRREIASLEGQLRYQTYQKHAAVEERMRIVRTLSKLEARVQRQFWKNQRAGFVSRMGHAPLRLQMLEGRNRA